MAEPFATVADITRHRTVKNEQVPAVEDLLQIASAKVRAKARGVDDRLSSGTLDPWLPKGVVIRMVTEVIDNPTKFTSEQVEDAAFRFDPTLVRQQMQLTSSELADLSPPAAKKRARSHHGVPCW